MVRYLKRVRPYEFKDPSMKPEPKHPSSCNMTGTDMYEQLALQTDHDQMFKLRDDKIGDPAGALEHGVYLSLTHYRFEDGDPSVKFRSSAGYGN